MTLRLRLGLVLVGMVAAVLLVADLVTYTSLRSYLYSQLDSQLQTATAPVARALVSCNSDEQITGGGYCRLPVEYYSQIPTGTFAQLRDSTGAALYSTCFSSSAAAANPGLPSPLPVGESAQSAKVFAVTNTGCGYPSYRGIAVTISFGTASGPYIEVLAIPTNSADQTVRRLETVELFVTLAVLALGAFAWWIVRRGLRPLDEMTATADAIAKGDLSRRVVDVDEQSEVGKLGAALNSMLGEIQTAFEARAASEERLRRFLADASHELRTPLTAIRGYAEMFDKARDRPEDLATSMRHIQDDANRMSLLVDDLLLLSKMDRERPLEIRPVDLTDIAASAVEASRLSAPDRQITLQVPGPTPLFADGYRLRQVLDNLLSNADRYSPPGTPVEVRVRADASTVTMEVADHGPGVPAAERDRIFEPFHRADPSRARSSGGVGLGLAIVSAIAKAHGGRAGVFPNTNGPDGGGAVFWVQVPRTPATANGAGETQEDGHDTAQARDAGEAPAQT